MGNLKRNIRKYASDIGVKQGKQFLSPGFIFRLPKGSFSSGRWIIATEPTATYFVSEHSTMPKNSQFG